jgi:hypothetical protein
MAAAEIQITDRDGWRKTFALDKSIVHVGTDPANDIVLETWRGSGIQPRHLQLIRLSQGSDPRYRLVNLGDAELHFEGQDGKIIPSHSILDLSGSETLRLGDFTLVFRALAAAVSVPKAQPAPAGAVAAASPTLAAILEPVRGGAASTPTPTSGVQAASSDEVREGRTSSAIGLSLSFPQAILTPDQPLQGLVTVRNLGQRTGVQIRLELDGLDPDCYVLGPGPILFPNAEREMQLLLHHPRRPSPAAGERCIVLRATAPDVYPGESAVVSATIDVKPFHDHRLRVVDSE